MSTVIVVGSFVQDLAFQTKNFPSPGETRIGRFQTGPGGKGFNQAVACNRLACETLFIGALGDDFFAKEVIAFAREENLQTAFEVIADTPCGAAAILINEKAENLIVVALGANEKLSRAHILEKELAFAQSKVVLCQLECALPPIETALQLGRKHGAITILNPAPIHPDVSVSLLECADILTPNETEFAFLLKHLYQLNEIRDVTELSDSDLTDLAARLPNQTIVITLGKEGAFVSHKRLPLPSWAEHDKRQTYRLPALKVQPVDTTGAGDAFSGALAAGLAQSTGSFEKTVQFAIAAASISTERPGTAPSMPKRAEVERRQ